MKYCLRILFPVMVLALVLGISGVEKAYGEYPEKMITYVCIFKAGGGTDRWARVMSSGAKDAFGQFWHVINIPGADGIVGWREALKKPADGYTIIQGSSTPVIALLKEEKPPISPFDVKIVCYVSAFRAILVAKPGKPWSTWEGLKEYAKKNPGKLTVGGTTSLLMGQANLFDQAGLKVTMVPYDSTGDAVADFLGGHIHLASATFSTVETIVPDEAVAVVNTSEIPIKKKGFEDLPNAKDLGYDGMAFPRWVGVHPDTSDPTVWTISEKMDNLLKHKSVTRLIKKMGEEIIFVPHAEAQQAYKKMVEGMKRTIKILEKK
jgi:tripartite-type tricarboxylate transporter receptor subunit TctC